MDEKHISNSFWFVWRVLLASSRCADDHPDADPEDEHDDNPNPPDDNWRRYTLE
jgi:hypothetical protein